MAYKLLLLDLDGTTVASKEGALPSPKVRQAVAMGNAPDEIKQLADFVTSSLEDDSVAVAIDKFILSK